MSRCADRGGWACRASRQDRLSTRRRSRRATEPCPTLVFRPAFERQWASGPERTVVPCGRRVADHSWPCHSGKHDPASTGPAGRSDQHRSVCDAHRLRVAVVPGAHPASGWVTVDGRGPRIAAATVRLQDTGTSQQGCLRRVAVGGPSRAGPARRQGNLRLGTPASADGVADAAAPGCAHLTVHRTCIRVRLEIVAARGDCRCKA